MTDVNDVSIMEDKFVHTHKSTSGHWIVVQPPPVIIDTDNFMVIGLVLFVCGIFLWASKQLSSPKAGKK